ncbi:HTH-type transcriptional regulator PksA [Marmoricola endophyticus]|uniref:HTH-type transcriptional regulator PksA n=1 Tax=Marmoricola endophyticus TaxID=2040280 RepID=A0A917EXC5_9ACTN|nr:TetR/AcrR family transcriptional regulator [Marmoricola endophyticus]GGF30622.1 HTH-type transcriptional regulator PksA [Marmoricola endophyticus]
MVRRINGDARRRELAEAVWRLVRRDGLAAASVRAVAAESGLSAGSVRHFFGTQSELIAFAMRELIDAVRVRVAEAAQEEDPVRRSTAVLVELLPLTEASHAEASAHLQLATQSRFDPALTDLADESFAGIRRVCRAALDWLDEAGEVRDDVDLDVATTALCALVDGLAFELVLAPRLLTADRAREALRDHLSSLSDPTVSSEQRSSS